MIRLQKPINRRSLDRIDVANHRRALEPPSTTKENSLAVLLQRKKMVTLGRRKIISFLPPASAGSSPRRAFLPPGERTIRALSPVQLFSPSLALYTPIPFRNPMAILRSLIQLSLNPRTTQAPVETPRLVHSSATERNACEFSRDSSASAFHPRSSPTQRYY